ncbi:unnamed protein product [Diamesa serratosioi]
MAAEDSRNAYKIAGHSKSSTKNQFWNRSFHILSCNDNVGSRKRTKFNKTSKCYSSNSRFLKRKEWTAFLDNTVNNINNFNNIGSNTETHSLIERRHNKKSNCFQSTSLVVDSQWRNSSTSWQNFLVFVVVVLLNIMSTNCLQARQEASSNCVFKPQWEGSWFISGVPQTIDIEGSTMSNRGRCIASDGDKFLMVEKRCHRCVVIYEKHKNVLQYKESMGCRGRDTLQFLCDQIPGDALLYSMFKTDAEPIKCPIKGPYTFTYNRGHGECRNPVSNIESCTEESRMLLSFQACPDVAGTESTVEELTCLAAWKDGNARYLVGLVSHNHATSNEERFRCFVYENINRNSGKYGGLSKDDEYKLAQSGDATCNGLESAEVGSRIMTLRRAPPVVRCDFPSWFKGPKHWHSLSGNLAYTFHHDDGSMHIVKQNGYLETRVLCEQINKQTTVEMMAVVHHATGCQSGFICMMFYRRDTHVAELQMGTPASRLEEACDFDHFDVSRLPFITMLASISESEVCPLEGSYTVRGLISPPYSISRHKRNHNTKHHHHDLSLDTKIPNNNNIKPHTSLSFRNEDDSLKNWHSNDRYKSLRQRRSTLLVDEEENAFNDVSDVDIDDATNIDDDDEDDVIKLVRNKRNNIKKEELNNLAMNFNADNEPRSRRESINCNSGNNNNVNNMARQLSIGCSDENVIDVSTPHCTDDSDEEYSCHGSWRENQTTFIIARHTGTKHGVCISFKQSTTDISMAQLYIGDSCYRENQVLDSLQRQYSIANLTNVGHQDYLGESLRERKKGTTNMCIVPQ